MWKGSVERSKAKLIDKVRGVLSVAAAAEEEEEEEEEEELAIEESAEIPEELPQDEFERRSEKILSKMGEMGISKGKQRRLKNHF